MWEICGESFCECEGMRMQMGKIEEFLSMCLKVSMGNALGVSLEETDRDENITACGIIITQVPWCTLYRSNVVLSMGG